MDYTPEELRLIESVDLPDALLQELRHEKTIGSKGHDLWGIPGAQLPAKMQHVYNDLVESGHPTGSLTYRLAVGIVQNWAHGKGAKDPKVIAEATAAVAEFEKLRAEAHARSAAKGAKRLAEERVGVIAEAFDGKKAPPFEKGGGRGGDKGGWTGEHKGGGGSPFGKGFGKCPTCDEPISQHDLGGRLKKDKVEEAELSSADREKLPDSAFVFPKDKRYPIHDLAHARNALARCSGKPEEGKVKAAVHAKYPQLKEEK